MCEFDSTRKVSTFRRLQSGTVATFGGLQSGNNATFKRTQSGIIASFSETSSMAFQNFGFFKQKFVKEGNLTYFTAERGPKLLIY